MQVFKALSWCRRANWNENSSKNDGTHQHEQAQRLPPLCPRVGGCKGRALAKHCTPWCRIIAAASGPAFENADTDAAAHYWEEPARCSQRGAAPVHRTGLPQRDDTHTPAQGTHNIHCTIYEETLSHGQGQQVSFLSKPSY